MKSPIINIAGIELKTHANSYRADRRGCRTLWCSDGFISNLIGAKQLG
jgi:hypothetical protein